MLWLRAASVAATTTISKRAVGLHGHGFSEGPVERWGGFTCACAVSSLKRWRERREEGALAHPTPQEL